MKPTILFSATDPVLAVVRFLTGGPGGLQPIRILVVDDHELVRRNICQLLAADPEFKVISEAATGAEAISKAGRYQPDVVLLDISLPELNGFRALGPILKVSPKSRVLMISNHDEAPFVRESLAVGAHGFLSKTELSTSLLIAVKTVYANQRFIKPLPEETAADTSPLPSSPCDPALRTPYSN
jgi:DNA-binding NarL/FixJ family response regulator